MSGAQTYFKVLDADGSTIYADSSWGLPRGDKPGRWEKAKGELVVCKNGLHLCRREDLIHWLGPRIFEAEVGGGKLIESDQKVVVRKARLVRELDTWNDRTARLFAADCAERVLPLFEKKHTNDTRPREAIEAARAFADSAAYSAVRSAADSAARSAADFAADFAAYSAAREWQTDRLFDYLEGRAS